MSTTGLDVKVKTWTPAVPCKIPDNIVSSQYTTAKVFVPSYEREKRPCIEQLMTNEYQRIWWQEKEVWDRRFATQIKTKKLLRHTLIKRKPQAPPPAKKAPKEVRKATTKTEPKKLEEKFDVKEIKKFESKPKGKRDKETKKIDKSKEIKKLKASEAKGVGKLGKSGKIVKKVEERPEKKEDDVVEEVEEIIESEERVRNEETKSVEGEIQYEICDENCQGAEIQKEVEMKTVECDQTDDQCN